MSHTHGQLLFLSMNSSEKKGGLGSVPVDIKVTIDKVTQACRKCPLAAKALQVHREAEICYGKDVDASYS